MKRLHKVVKKLSLIAVLFREDTKQGIGGNPSVCAIDAVEKQIMAINVV
ncbi:hypothetical protein [Fulvivirga sp.]